MREIRSYLVRVYRHDAEALAGVVEDVRSSRIAPFQSLAELCQVLSGHKRFAPRAVRRRSRSAP